MLSLAEAAGLTGPNKTTLLRSIKSGRMTGSKDALGQWQVHEAELLRVYQPAANAAGERGDVASRRSGSAAGRSERLEADRRTAAAGVGRRTQRP